MSASRPHRLASRPRQTITTHREYRSAACRRAGARRLSRIPKGPPSVTQSQLENAVADATGESVRTVHRLGFRIAGASAARLEPEDLRLYIDCPFCGHAVAYPGQGGDGMPAMAECLACDVYFDYASDEVYAAEPDHSRASTQGG
jgi:hypothetical protein